MSKRHPRKITDPTANKAIGNVSKRPPRRAVSWPGLDKNVSASTVLKVLKALKTRYPTTFGDLDRDDANHVALRAWYVAGCDLSAVTLDHVINAKAAIAGRN